MIPNTKISRSICSGSRPNHRQFSPSRRPKEYPKCRRSSIPHEAVQSPAKRDAIRRRQTITESLDNEETLYFAKISLGTPAQNLRLRIDTGSSDLWANAKSSQICSSKGDPYSASVTYDANSSRTSKSVSNNFNASYFDDSGASGDYATDTLSSGGQVLKDLQFGIGYEPTSPEGILGIGCTDRTGQRSYSNVPQAMAYGGLIQSNTYSLWLGDFEASTGSVLFGAVDTECIMASCKRSLKRSLKSTQNSSSP